MSIQAQQMAGLELLDGAHSIRLEWKLTSQPQTAISAANASANTTTMKMNIAPLLPGI